ncbi:amino acid adenylation domain-containing protein [Streptosporangium sp. OZ121]|uniref:amino acid adenylation domain-containing protein n=1 Tax=Streptosporangium sp. OZ121 TaxID=3444183 RepID=UPI003F7ABB33
MRHHDTYASARPAFVFPGQGAVWPGMAVELLDSSPVFARRVGDCADALAPHVEWSLVDVLRAERPSTAYERANVSEPVLFAVQVSLAALWRSHGVEPHAVAGYSLGEVAAACVVGALSLDEAARVIALWSEAQARATDPGAMALLALPLEEAQVRLAPLGDAVSVAGVLAPRSVVVAGDRDEIVRLVAETRAEGTYAQKLSLGVACHSPRMAEQRDWLLDSLGEVTRRDVETPFYSSVTGGRLATGELDAGYWYRNMRQVMLFEQVTRAMLADGHTALIEPSPHPVLTTAMRATVESAGGRVPVIGTLYRGHQDMNRFLSSLAEVPGHGVAAGADRAPNEAGRPVATSPADASTVGATCRAAGPQVPPPDGDELVEAVCDLIVAAVRGGTAPEVTVGDVTLGRHDHETGLFDLGFDSVRLVALQDLLERRLDVSLESTFTVDHPAVGALVRELGPRVEGRDTERRVPAPAAPTVRADPSEPVALVGMAFRLPGGIGTREHYWEVLSEGIDVVTEIPADRWRQSPLDTAGVTTTQGGYLGDVDRFDPLFFNISPKEAQLLDPQQRLLLELTWEAFEDAGIDPLAAGEDRRVGTFVGIYNNDYQQVGADLGHAPDAYTYTGNMANAAAGRISYVYGFRGPSMAVDTACSSSLYAVHLGMRELRQGGCDLVVAAGVNLILSPEVHLSWSRLNALSPSGRCRSFDDGADGYIRSEGGAVVLLKRLSDAERDGDRILAVLSGSAINHNGRSGGFTVPSGTAQADVIRSALADAGLGIEDVSYVETHGSGTPIGDPQEVNALARVFADRRTKLPISSVKSNLGHLEAAAGMAALCKVVLAIEHGRLPGTLHFRTGNRRIDWERIPIEVVSEETPWEPAGGRRRAGITSLGISGTNAHVIVEEHRPREPVRTPRPAPDTPQLLTVSAQSEAALHTTLRNLAEWSGNATAPLADVAHTLGRRRALRYRRALVCGSPADIPAAAEAAASDDTALPDGHAAGEVFVFSGQGTQYPGMARELYDHAEIFRREMDELDSAFSRAGGASPLKAMFGDDEAVFASPLHTQPMIFTVELALARYWQALGVTPAAVLGHSIGEYGAACFAGVMSQEQAVDLVTRRARVMEDTPRDGGMATLLCSRERAEELLRDFPEVSVAAVNASENVTVSGRAQGLDAVLRKARKQRIFVERLDISHPFHSRWMDRGAEELYEQIRDQRFAAPKIPWISAQTGRPVTRDSMIGAEYWSRHLVDPVLFTSAVGTAAGRGLRVFVEVAPMATLGGLIAQDATEDVVTVPSLRKGRSDTRQFLESAGLLWRLGRALEWDRLPGRPGGLVPDLPRTSFDRQRIWYGDHTGNGGVPMSPGVEDGIEEMRARDARRTAERETIRTFLTGALGEITGVAVDTMDESLELFSLGIDSLMLVQLVKRIDRRFSVDFPIRMFFESLHTVGQLTDFVLEHRPAEPTPRNDLEASAPAGADGTSASSGSSAQERPAAAVPSVARTAAVAQQAPGTALEAVVQAQLELMRQQLSLLAGTPDPAGSVAAPVADATVREPRAATPARADAPRTPRKVGSYNNNIALTDDRLTGEQSRFIADFVARYVARTRKSKEYADRYRGRLADWIASLNFNPSVKETVYPVVSARSSGATFWDLDGNEYVDTAIGYGVHVFGHNPSFVADAVRRQLDHGYELGPQNGVAGEVAELVHQMTGAERVAFCNTGTEAVMVSLRLARAVSGRDKVLRFTNSYHGSSDGVLAETDGTATVPLTIGVPQGMVDNTVVRAYGSPGTLEWIRENGAELAAVLVEPVQSRNPALQPGDFLRELREICTEHGIALIFDEMITGFRVGLGGAQAYFGVKADMALYGKLVAGGLPIGIVAGRSRYLDAVDGGAWVDTDDSKPAAPTTFFAGTFCKHPLAMAASKAVLTRLKESGAEMLAGLNDYTAEFARRVNEYFEAEEVPLTVAHFASMYKWEPVAPRDVAHASLTQNLFFKLLNHHGVYVWERRTATFSVAHTREHQDRILEAVRASVEELRAGGFDFRRRQPAAAPPGNRGTSAAGTTVEPRPDAPVDVTSLEQRVYVLSRMRGGNEAYQIVFGLRFDGPLDQERVAAAFRAIGRRHPNLRRHYVVDPAGVRAGTAPDVTPEFHLFDRGQDPSLTVEDILAVMNAPLDLARPPLWRYGIVVDPDGTHHLVVTFHHIAVDGRSIEIIFNDLSDHLTHGRLDDGEGSDDYATFVRLLSGAAARPEYADHRRWWLEQFATVPGPLSLPTDSPPPAVNDFAGRRHYFEVDPELHRAATAVIRRQRTTPSVFYLSLWALLLAKVTGEDDLCVGVPMDQRMLGSFEKTVGMFAESLPLRVRPAAGTRVSDFLRQVRETSLAAMSHSLYPYSVLVQELDLARDHGHNALFDTMFIYTDARTRARRYGEVTATTEDLGARGSMFAFTFELTERDGGLFADLNHSSVYGEERIAALMDRFRALLAQVVQDPDRTIGELSLLDDAARERLVTWGTGPVVTDLALLPELFDAACERYAQEPAVLFRGTDVTYGQLAERVDRHAALLRAHGARRGDVIGLLLRPSPELITLMLAANRIGCAWLPMDVATPPKRLAHIVETAEPAVIVCSEDFGGAPDLGSRVLVLKEGEPPGTAADEASEAGAARAGVTADDLAYVIFTSGSTGRPKGVTVTNGALANFLRGMPDALGWSERKAVACLTTPSFDIHVLETLLTLVTGGTVVVADEDEARTPASIAEFVVRNGVDYVQLTPTRLRLLHADPDAAFEALSALEKLIVGGEAFPEDLLDGLRKHASLEIFNVYGPTETCIWSSVKNLTGDTALSIGTPIANTTFHVLDDDLRMVPEGMPGDLWIGGLGVSPGYLNRPDLNGEVFRDNPFGAGRIYRSGDRAVWKDGEVHCLGRTDNQVKVRGHRIELEEIEQAIAGHELVTAAAAVVHELSPGNRVIRGFYQAKRGEPLREEALKGFLAERLPDYMIPATLTEVPGIPVTTSGKVDRKALERQAAEWAAPGREGAARPGVERELVAAWKRTLGDIPIGRDDSFFDLGGNSFSLILLLNDLDSVFPGLLDVSDLFAHPTIGRLRGHIEGRLAQRDAGASPAETGVRLPDTWFAKDGTGGGRIEAVLSPRIRDGLARLGKDVDREPEELVLATFALTLGKMLGQDDLDLCVVRSGDDVVPVRFGFAGKTDLREILDDDEHRPDGANQVDLSHFTAGRNAGGRVSIACCDSRQVDETRLLRHFDLVLGLDLLADPSVAGIGYARKIGSASVERLLSGFVRLLGVLSESSETDRSRTSKEKDNS